MSSMNAPSGEIEHISYLSDHIGALFLNEEYSDVTFVVEGGKILTSVNLYFSKILLHLMQMSYTQMFESTSV